MTTTQTHHPVESFMRDYLPAAGGEWELVEPQVYDLLLPESFEATDSLVRVVLDQEALAEHPGSQFMTLGTPLVDELLRDARERGSFARGYVNGLNLYPFGLEKRVRKTLDLPSKATLEIDSPEPRDVSIAVYWFEATFVSDQKEQASFHDAVDLHQSRNVRHLERLMDQSVLDDEPVQPLEPAARQNPLTTGYRLAREEVTASVAAAANPRRREIEQRAQRQEQRMARYYQDLIAESDQRLNKAFEKHQDPTKEHNRRQNIIRERDIRLAEVRKKAALRVNLRLTNVLEIHQPKLLMEARLSAPSLSESIPFTLTWDPLTEALEPLDCPQCARPGFSLRLPRREAGWRCSTCVSDSK